MLSLRCSSELARVLNGPLNPEIARLLALRRDQLLENDDDDLRDFAHFIVAQPGDTLAEVEAEAGTSLSPVQADESDYVAPFEWVELHPGGWLEAVLIFTDDGFASVLFVPDATDVDPQLRRLLKQALT